MVAIGKGAGKQTVAVLTNMGPALGRAARNALKSGSHRLSPGRGRARPLGGNPGWGRRC